jgi:hypothetical protein
MDARPILFGLYLAHERIHHTIEISDHPFDLRDVPARVFDSQLLQAIEPPSGT